MKELFIFVFVATVTPLLVLAAVEWARDRKSWGKFLNLLGIATVALLLVAVELLVYVERHRDDPIPIDWIVDTDRDTRPFRDTLQLTPIPWEDGQ